MNEDAMYTSSKAQMVGRSVLRRVKRQVARPARREVNGMRVIASMFGVCVGVSGLDHGLFEALQGNTATPGLIVQAIGPAQRMWIHGTEEAFTIVPNFLATGVASMVVGAVTIAWSVGFIDRPNGSRVLLLLGGLMFLVGGGIGMLPFLVLAWAVARRIHRPMASWKSVLPIEVERVLSRAWPGLVAADLALYAFALEVAIVGFVPGVRDPDRVLLVCWSTLLAMLPVAALALVGASAEQIARAAAGDPSREARRSEIAGPSGQGDRASDATW
jgi:hypothetical protein